MGVRWLRLVPGVALFGVAVWVAVTRSGPLAANHPAYPLTLLVAGVLGLLLVVTAFTARRPPRGGWWRWTLRGVGALAGVVVALGLGWLRPFPADPAALAALAPSATVSVAEDRSSVTFTPEKARPGALVLYPGARVDPRAYSVLARAVAERGHEVVVLKCPYDIAFLCTGRSRAVAGDGVGWAVGGHSLGGVAAAQDVTDAAGSPAGLLLWAAYPAGDLSGRTGLAAASVSGSADGLSTPADIAASRAVLPADTVFTVVEGAVHAYFGDYGEQPGDGTPTVSRAEAQRQIVDASVALLERVGAASGR